MARTQASRLPGCWFTSRRADVSRCDYAIASGLFNVKQDVNDAEWKPFVEETVRDLASLASRGFGFNALTVYSAEDRRRPDLYYPAALYWFDYCKRTYGHPPPLHDYPLWGFTVIARRHP